jgi:hypothetical protein
MLMAIPLSTRQKPDPHYVPYIFENRMFSAVISQARLLDSRRLLRKIYTLPKDDFAVIKQAFLTQFIDENAVDKKSDSAETESSEPEGDSTSIVAKSVASVKSSNNRGRAKGENNA